jgi:RNA polymerase sigma-70 factor, ECF subfamily
VTASDPETDEELVGRALSGERDALATLVERHQRRVYNLCLRVMGHPEDAADAAQEALVTALRKLGQFRGEAAFTTWLHRLTVNTCYDLLRKRRRQPLLHLVTEEGAEPEPGPPVEDHADAVAGAADVVAALAQVPEEFRVALVLADIQDLPYEEIAKVLDVPVGTVKSRVHRGRVALARAMGINRESAAREPVARSQPSEDEA